MTTDVLTQLDKYDLQGFSHSDEGLVAHLQGTYDLLKEWGCREELCVAGLCHSIYGTESYRQNPIELSEREDIQKIIGKEPEQLAYLFGAHVKDSLWENLDRDGDYAIRDRLAETTVPLSKGQLADLITLTLANWLEQRPRAPEKYARLREREFRAAEAYLPSKGYEAFTTAYGLA